MFYRIIDINEIFTNKENDHEIIEVMSNNSSQLKLVSVKKNAGFNSHMFNTNVFIYMTDGEIQLEFTKKTICGCDICGITMPDKHNGEKEEYKIKKGQIFMFKKDVMHSLKALKDSKFILVKI